MNDIWGYILRNRRSFINQHWLVYHLKSNRFPLLVFNLLRLLQFTLVNKQKSYIWSAEKDVNTWLITLANVHNLQLWNWSLKKILRSGLNGIRTHDLSDTGAVLYQLALGSWFMILKLFKYILNSVAAATRRIFCFGFGGSKRSIYDSH